MASNRGARDASHGIALTVGHEGRGDGVHIPKLRQGSLVCAASQALSGRWSRCPAGPRMRVSRRRVDQIVRASGCGLARRRSEPDRRTAQRAVRVFRERPSKDRYLSIRGRERRSGPRRRRHSAFVRGHGPWRSWTGRREIMALEVADAETQAFRRDFVRPLVDRGVVGVQRRRRPAAVPATEARAPRGNAGPETALGRRTGTYPVGAGVPRRRRPSSATRSSQSRAPVPTSRASR
jgi:hypothetical protein